MKIFTTPISALALVLALGTAASAQGVIRGTEGGAAAGAAAGGAAAGPLGAGVGAAVGGVVGGVTGTVGGILGVDQRPAFRQYVGRQGYSSYSYSGPVAVGSVLPGSGVTYYDVPSDYGVRGYRYTIVNGSTVLVDPATGRIVQIIE